MISTDRSEKWPVAELLLAAAVACYLISFGLPFDSLLYGYRAFVLGLAFIWFPPAWPVTIGWLANPIAWYLASHSIRSDSRLTIFLSGLLFWVLVMPIWISLRDGRAYVPGPAFWLWEFSLWLIVFRQWFLPKLDLRDEFK